MSPQLTPDEARRWRRVEEICDAAMQLAGSDRDAYLATACDADEALRREVEALLVHEKSSKEFLSAPVGAIAARVLEPPRDLIGTRIADYEIVAKLGAGGMGEVYRARDAKLGRDVAIKVLSPAFTADRERLARFDREARLLASLNHPHIGAIYGVEAIDDQPALILELVEGDTLAARLKASRLPIAEALAIARQIAEALEAAHRAGVVHRDLKPANVMITKTGVKLLDFGVAKMTAGEGTVQAGGQVMTISALTGDGALIGTLPFMAPEQLEGRSADKRTDIFALGVVLFEMTTGKRPFEGASQASLVTAIMSADVPAMSTLRAGVPPGFDRVVKKCLAKDPDARWQDAGDLAAELQWVGEQAETVRAPVVPRATTAKWATALLLTALAAAGGTWLLKPDVQAPAAVSAHLTVDLPPGAVFERFTRPVLALSPDGQLLIYAAQLNGKLVLFRRAIDRRDAEVLTETGIASHPFFSPDGQWVAFQSEGALKKMAVSGGAAFTIAKVAALTGAAWGADGHIVMAAGTRAPVVRVPASGGEPREITTFDRAKGETGHRFPDLLPGGKVVIFTAGPPMDGPWHEADIVAQSLETGERHTLIRGGTQPRYVAPGYLVYARAGTLYAVAFDATTVRVTGQPVAVLDGVREDPAHGASQFVVSANGTLAYVSGGLETAEVVLVDRQGRATPLMPFERRYFSSPRFSPDGSRLALTVGGGNDAIFVHPLGTGGLSRVTSGTNHISAAWSPDGKRVTTQKTVTGELVSTEVDRNGPEDVLYRAAGEQPSPMTWSRDGRSLAFVLRGDIWTLTLPERRAEPLIDSRFVEIAPAISPDGRWLAYVSNESAVQEVYVQEFRKGGQRWLVSNSGGTEPVWARDSQQLYFRNGSRLFAVGARPPFTGAVELFDTPWALLSNRPEYDVSPDGDRFVMIRPPDRSAARIHLILNWVDELQRRVPR